MAARTKVGQLLLKWEKSFYPEEEEEEGGRMGWDGAGTAELGGVGSGSEREKCRAWQKYASTNGTAAHSSQGSIVLWEGTGLTFTVECLISHITLVQILMRLWLPF